MRIAVISDIHGNYRALQAVLADIARAGVTTIIALGDNIGYGPEPEEVIQTLIAHRVASVLGNHELALIDVAYCKRLNPGTRISLELTRGMLSPASLDFCRLLPPTISRDGALFVHGSPPDSITSYLWDARKTKLARLFNTYDEGLCCYGHTHDLARFVKDGDLYQRQEVTLGETALSPACRYLINPGSVGQPRDNLSHLAKYGIWDQKRRFFEIRALPYDVEATVALLQARGFPEFNASRLLP